MGLREMAQGAGDDRLEAEVGGWGVEAAHSVPSTECMTCDLLLNTCRTCIPIKIHNVLHKGLGLIIILPYLPPRWSRVGMSDY